MRWHHETVRRLAIVKTGNRQNRQSSKPAISKAVKAETAVAGHSSNISLPDSFQSV